MPRFFQQLSFGRRRTVWLSFLLCLWMTTGGVLFHADGAWASNHSRASLAPAASLLMLTPCAACEWAAGALTLAVAASHFSAPIAFFRPPSVALLSFPRPRPTRSFSRRAPPTLLFSCV